MRISDWSSDVCSSDLCSALGGIKFLGLIQQYYSLVFRQTEAHHWPVRHGFWNMRKKIAADNIKLKRAYEPAEEEDGQRILVDRLWPRGLSKADRSEEHTSELQSLMRKSYDVFCLKKKNQTKHNM